MTNENRPTARAFRDAFISSYGKLRLAFTSDRWAECWSLHPSAPVLALPSENDRLPPEIQKSLLTLTAEEMGVRYSVREQLHLDAVFSSKENSSTRKGWFPILVAIEHENDRTGFETEVIKLLSVRCPLKVGITYSLYSEEAQVPGRLQEILTYIRVDFERIRSVVEEESRTEYLFLVGVELRKPEREISRWYSLDFRFCDGPQSRTFQLVEEIAQLQRGVA
jgi:hypothetical protein